jgi:hypothetical protein
MRYRMETIDPTIPPTHDDAPSATQTATQNKVITVTIRTPAGHHHEFEVRTHERVDKVAREAVRYFVERHELDEGQYGLALVRDGVAQPMEDAARLEDYDVRPHDVLALISKQPQIDG